MVMIWYVASARGYTFRLTETESMGPRLRGDDAARASRPVEELQRVDRRRALADLEVQLRRADLAGLARLGNDLAALDGFAALHHEFTRMGIGGDVAVGVPDQDQIAVALELISRIGNDAVFGSLHGRALGHRDVDAVVGLAIGLGAIAGDDAAAHRPAEGRQRAGGFGGLHRRFGDGSGGLRRL